MVVFGSNGFVNCYLPTNTITKISEAELLTAFYYQKELSWLGRSHKESSAWSVPALVEERNQTSTTKGRKGASL